MGLLAAEMIAKTGRDPSQLFTALTDELGVPYYERLDVAATAKQKNALKSVSPEQLNIRELAGDPVRAVRREQRINLIRHVAVVAQTAGRVGGVVCVFDQTLAVALVAAVAGGVAAHAVLDLMVGVALVHAVATQATHLAVTVLVARRQRHPLVFQRRRQR